MKIFTQTLQHKRKIFTYTHLWHSKSSQVSNEKEPSFDTEKNHFPQGESKKLYKDI
jgi:hypothetical protein